MNLRLFYWGLHFFLLISLLSCTSSSGPSEIPTLRSPKNTPTPIKSINPPLKDFLRQDLNEIKPDDVLEEIAFGAVGGGDDSQVECKEKEFNSPAIDESWSNSTSNWFFPIYIASCGWWSDSFVKVSILLPDGNVLADETRVRKTEEGIPYIVYEYISHIDNPPGIYNFSFQGNSGTVTYNVNVKVPNTPTASFFDNVQAFYLYGFHPKEKIRFLLYTTSMEDVTKKVFSGWQEYTVNENGQLVIKIDYVEGIYFVIGELSGPVDSLAGDLPWNESPLKFASKIRMENKDEIKLSSKSCPNALPSRLEIGKYAYVATTPPL